MRMKKVLCSLMAVSMLSVTTFNCFAEMPVGMGLILSASAENTVKPDSIVLGGGYVSSNVSKNNYSTWSKVMNSYLHETEDFELERVEYTNGKILVEKSSYDGKTVLESKNLDLPLSIFGGCYFGKNYNFIVSGNENPNDSDSVEIMRVQKYSKSWELLESTSVKGANTYAPFDGGSLRMIEAEGKLYIYTCHEMYASSDGYHHQSNMTYVYNEDDMSLTESFYGVSNIGQRGYVSHSFNQYITTDGKYIYRADHGDAYPRALSITRCPADESITRVNCSEPFAIAGNIGNNNTGVSLGGFEVSENNCILVGNSVVQDNNNYNPRGKRNIFLCLSPLDYDGSKNSWLPNDYYDDEYVTEKTKGEVVWLTDYTDDSTKTVYTPQIVKVNSNEFIVMWEEKDSKSYETVLKIASVNGDGKLNTDIVSTENARLSDCQPFVDSNGLVRWYAADGKELTYYTLDPENINLFDNEPVPVVTTTTTATTTTTTTTTMTKPTTTTITTTTMTKPTTTTITTTTMTKPTTTTITTTTMTKPTTTTITTTTITKPTTTTITTTTMTKPETTTTTKNSGYLFGDSNCDGLFSIADATTILQSLGNPDKYALTEQGKINADVYGNGDGVTALDALFIQKIDAKVIDINTIL